MTATTRGVRLTVAAVHDAHGVGSRLSRARLPASWTFVGAHAGTTSPVRAPGTINYLLVTLNPGKRWSYQPPAGHLIAWVTPGKGSITVAERVSNGELAMFEQSEMPIRFEGAVAVRPTFVLGSAVPHPYQLHLGSYSVHTSIQALAAGRTPHRCPQAAAGRGRLCWLSGSVTG